MATGLDEIDMMMLEQLQKNGRISNVDLSKAVGISPPPCLRRLRYLEDTGVITGYHAKIDYSAIGRGFEAICIITLRTNQQGVTFDFIRKIQSMEYVLGIVSTIGGKEFVLKIVARDYNEFDSILTKDISQIRGVYKIKPYIVVRSYKEVSEIPLSTFVPEFCIK